MTRWENHFCVPVQDDGQEKTLHAYYDWGASATLITHAAARRINLTPQLHEANVIEGLGGEVILSGCSYRIPLSNGKGETQWINAVGVSEIAKCRKS